MTSDERSIALQQLGYTPRQAAFLALVAVHGGYFLRRQFQAFLAQPDGGVLHDLLERLLERKHASRQVGAREQHVYHLCARPVYAALGLGDSRNRRPIWPSGIAVKLMTLDVVLQWRDRVVLGTEAEKVRFFTEEWALDAHRLPAKLYPSATPGVPPTTRYFVDKAPIALTPGTPDVTVAYVQGWASGTGGFRTFLQQYRKLLISLPSVTVLYCATRRDRVEPARWVWARTFGMPLPEQRPLPDPAELRAFFRLCHRDETGQGGALSSVERARFLEDCRRYTAPGVQALYRRWCAAGDIVLETCRRPISRVPSGPVPRFESLLLTQHYPWLPTTKAKDRSLPGPSRTGVQSHA